MSLREAEMVTARRGGAAPRLLALLLLLGSSAFASLFGATPVQAERKPINLIAILDVSTSMRGTFVQMQDYVYGSIVGKLLRSGDYLSLFTFGVRVKKVFAGKVELPRDEARLKSLVYGMAADEDGTDIGLMLESLDAFLKAGGLPNERTSIMWATDGKNDPPPGSRYVGKNIFDPAAFASYTILKSSSYKVLLLSIGANTAAKDLSGPMGGEYLEVGRDVTASKLDAIMGDFTSSIEVSAPATLQHVSPRNPKIKLGIVSNFAQAKDLRIERILLSVDGGPMSEAAAPGQDLRLEPKSRVDIDLSLPTGLSKGEHSAEVEIRLAGGEALGPQQRLSFSYASETNPFEAGIVIVLIAISAACILVASVRRV